MFETCDVVHVAAHGTFRSDHPLLSTLRLAKGDATMYDAVPDLVKSRLVILSTCKGGAHGTTDGSEMLGLSAVLRARGAAAVLAPLTVVRELEYTVFVAEVHGELAAGLPFAAVRARWLADVDLSRWAVASSFTRFGSGAVSVAHLVRPDLGRTGELPDQPLPRTRSRRTLGDMPEGDTLRLLATRINDRLGGGVVERSIVRDPRLVGVDLTGTTLVDADAYGKHLFIRFDDGRSLHAHLLMTGGFAVGRASREIEWKRRIELWLDRGRLTGEKVPILGIVQTLEEHTITDPLGADLCAADGPPDIDEVVERLRSDPDRPLVGALLDQRNVAGFGNVYVNDVPFITGVNPEQPIGTIARIGDLVAVGTAMIRVNASRGFQNTTGKRLHTDARWVHGVGRRPCPVCGTRLDYRDERESAWNRSITWCPSCQPLGAAGAVDLRRARRLIGLHPAVKEPMYPA